MHLARWTALSMAQNTRPGDRTKVSELARWHFQDYKDSRTLVCDSGQSLPAGHYGCLDQDADAP